MVTIVRGITPSLNVDFSDVPEYPAFCFFNNGYGGLQGWSELSATAHTAKIERRVTT